MYLRVTCLALCIRHMFLNLRVLMSQAACRGGSRSSRMQAIALLQSRSLSTFVHTSPPRTREATAPSLEDLQAELNRKNSVRCCEAVGQEGERPVEARTRQLQESLSDRTRGGPHEQTRPGRKHLQKITNPGADLELKRKESTCLHNSATQARSAVLEVLT